VTCTDRIKFAPNKYIPIYFTRYWGFDFKVPVKLNRVEIWPIPTVCILRLQLDTKL
jgi:hypothetical protein